MIKTMKKSLAYDITSIATGAALITLCSWITVPLLNVPFTLQTFGVFLVAALLGFRRGVLSVLTYILIGLVGAPVFSGFKSGPAALFGPTGGYILAFLVSAVIIALAIHFFGKKIHVMIISMIIGLAACYALGTLMFVLVYPTEMSVYMALTYCVFPFILPDLIKLTLAAFLTKRLSIYLK